MDDSVKAIVARACEGRYPRMFGEQGPKPPPLRIPVVVESSGGAGAGRSTPPAKAPTTPYCKHTILEISVRPCLKCNRLCNCGFTYYRTTEYPDVMVRSLDGHLVLITGEMVRASDTLRGMVDRCNLENKVAKSEINVVLEREENGNFNSILKYKIVDKNRMTLKEAGEAQSGQGKAQVDAQPEPEVNVQPKKRPSLTDYPVRNSARNFAKMKAEARKMRENEKKVKVAALPVPAEAPSTTIETPSTSLRPPSSVNKTKKKSRVRHVLLDIKKQPYFIGREVNHPRLNFLEVEDETPTTPVEDLIDLGERNSKVLALFDRQSNRPTLGVCKDTLLKIQHFVNMHLDTVERKVAAMNRLFDFQDNSPYSTSVFLTVSDMRLSNSFVYEEWEEEFFHKMDSQTFLDVQQANLEIQIWDLYMAFEKWAVLNRGFPQEMDNGFLDLMDLDKPDDFDEKDTRAAIWGVPFVEYPNPYRVSFHLCGKEYPHKLPVVNFKPTWFCIIDPL